MSTASTTAPTAQYSLNCFFAEPKTDPGNKSPQAAPGITPLQVRGHKAYDRNWGADANQGDWTVTPEGDLQVKATKVGNGTFIINFLCPIQPVASDMYVQLGAYTTGSQGKSPVALDEVFSQYQWTGQELVPFPSGAQGTFNVGGSVQASQWTAQTVQGPGVGQQSSQQQTLYGYPAITFTFKDQPASGVSVRMIVYVKLAPNSTPAAAIQYFDDPKMEVTTGTGTK